MGLDLHSIEAYHRSLGEAPDGCSQAVAHYLARIEAHRHLNAFLEVYTAEALARARALDEKRRTGQPLGKLHGVVIALKDVISYKGHTLSAGSKILEGYTSVYHATVDRKSTRLNSSHVLRSRMPSSA